MTKKRGFGSITPHVGNNDKLRMGELVEEFSLPKEANGTWVNLRFLDTNMLPVKIHWIKIMAGKESKKEIKIPKLCVSFDPDAESTPKEGTHCPYCELSSEGGDQAICQTGTAYYANVIVRDLQADEPRKKVTPSSKELKSGIIEIGSKTWSPVRVVRLPTGLANKLNSLGERNLCKVPKMKDKQPKNIDDPKYGLDIGIKFNAKASGTDKYELDKGERTPLTDEEKAYLVWDLSDDLYGKMGLESTKEAAIEFKRLDIVGSVDLESDDEDDEDEGLRLGSKKKRKARDEDEDEDEDEDDTPKRKKRKTRDEDEDEDDVPKRTKRKVSGSTVKKTKKLASTGAPKKKKRVKR